MLRFGAANPAPVAAMDRFVARQNIEHFAQQLSQERDPEKRAHLQRLLDEAREQLRQAEAAHRQNPPKRTG